MPTPDSPFGNLAVKGVSNAPYPTDITAIAKSHVQAYASVRAGQKQSGEDPNAQPPVAPPRRSIEPSTPPQQSSPEDTAAPVGRKFNYNTDNPDSIEQEGYQRSFDAITQEAKQEQETYDALSRAQSDAGRFANFQKDSYTNERLAEMQPTADLDSAILQLRQKALYEQASLWESLQGVPLDKALNVMNGRQNEYAKQIDDLAKMRTTRLDIAKAKITDEIDHITGQQDAAKTRVDALKTALESAKAQGATSKELGTLEVDIGKAEKAYQKTKSGSNGLATDAEYLQVALEGEGVPAANAKLLAKTIKLDPDTMKKLRVSGGDPRSLDQTTSTTNPPKSSWFGFLSTPQSPTTTTTNPLDAYVAGNHKGGKTMSEMSDMINKGQWDKLTPAEQKIYQKAYAAANP